MKEALIERIESTRSTNPAERICVGTIVKIKENGQVWVDVSGNEKGPIQAYYTNAFKAQIENQSDIINQKVLLLFHEEDLEMPVIIDTLHSKADHQNPSPIIISNEVDEVVVDGKRVTFQANEEIILKCGKAIIHMTKAGKIIIRGTYLLNRSSGVNRIKGGSIQLN